MSVDSFTRQPAVIVDAFNANQSLCWASMAPESRLGGVFHVDTLDVDDAMLCCKSTGMEES